MTEKPSSSGRRIKSVSRVIPILEEISRHDDVSLSELSERLEMPKSSLHHYLESLQYLRIITKENERYRMSLKLLTYSGRVRDSQQAFSNHKQRVDALARKAGQNAQVVVEENMEGVYLYQSIVNDNHTDTCLGTRVGLHSSAAGKAILAQLPDTAVREYLENRDLERFTENTVVDAETLWEEVETIRREGVAFDDEEQFPGVRCVAGPIGQDNEQYTAAISITATVSDLNTYRFKNEIPSLVKFLDERAIFEKDGM